MRKIERPGYLLMATFCCLVCVFDNTLTWVTRETILDMEENAYGSWLMTSFGVEGFIQIKAACTLLLFPVLWVLSRTKYRPLVAGLTALQASLFIYLTCAPGSTPDHPWAFDLDVVRSVLHVIGGYYL